MWRGNVTMKFFTVIINKLQHILKSHDYLRIQRGIMCNIQPVVQHFSVSIEQNQIKCEVYHWSFLLWNIHKTNIVQYKFTQWESCKSKLGINQSVSCNILVFCILQHFFLSVKLSLRPNIFNILRYFHSFHFFLFLNNLKW